MPISEYQEKLERRCKEMILEHEPTWNDVGHVYITCVSRAKHWAGPWWEVRCISNGPERVDHLVHRGPSAHEGTRLVALKAMADQIWIMRDLMG